MSGHTGRRRWIAITGVLAVLTTLMWVLTFDGSSVPGMAVLGGYRDRWFLVNLLLSYLTVVAGVLAIVGASRSTILKLIAMNLSIVCVFGVLELVAAVGIVDYRGIMARTQTRPSKIDDRLRNAGRPNIRVEGNAVPDLASWLGADAEPVPYVFETDRYGLRNPIDKEDPRVVCLGDSILVAGLLPVESTVTERLEQKLGVSVLSVAEVGYAPQEELIRLQTTGLDGHRLVVQFIFEGNDLGDSYQWRKWRDSTFETEWPKSGLTKSLLRLLDRPRRAAGRRRTGLFPADAPSPKTVYFLYDSTVSDSESEWVHLREALLTARDDIVSRGGRYAVVLVPDKLTVLYPYCAWPPESELDDPALWESALRSDLARFCAKEDIQYLDLTTALRLVAAEGELPYFANDTHLNERGHEAMAEALAPWVASGPCTPATCQSLGQSCGQPSDSCGGRLDCGECGDGETCVSGLCVNDSNPPSEPAAPPLPPPPRKAHGRGPTGQWPPGFPAYGTAADVVTNGSNSGLTAALNSSQCSSGCVIEHPGNIGSITLTRAGSGEIVVRPPIGQRAQYGLNGDIQIRASNLVVAGFSQSGGIKVTQGSNSGFAWIESAGTNAYLAVFGNGGDHADGFFYEVLYRQYSNPGTDDRGGVRAGNNGSAHMLVVGSVLTGTVDPPPAHSDTLQVYFDSGATGSITIRDSVIWPSWDKALQGHTGKNFELDNVYIVSPTNATALWPGPGSIDFGQPFHTTAAADYRNSTIIGAGHPREPIRVWDSELYEFPTAIDMGGNTVLTKRPPPPRVPTHEELDAIWSP
ncbi:MAG: hypothetical protein WBM46_13780 [Polyangiales bacterium]